MSDDTHAPSGGPDDTDNLLVVDFTPKDGDKVKPTPSVLLPRPPRKLGDPPYCEHAAVYVDGRTRMVTCQNEACGAIVDPTNFLLLLANREARLLWTREEVTRLHAEKDDLLRTVKNLKAQKKRLDGVAAGRDAERKDVLAFLRRVETLKQNLRAVATVADLAYAIERGQHIPVKP